MTTKAERLQHANDLIELISNYGRRFFFDQSSGRIAKLEIDPRGRIWFVDDYNGKAIYTHNKNSWRGFSHGGTLRSLIEALRDYISRDVKLHREYIAPERMNPGSNIWGYSNETAKILREAAFQMPLFK